jgi:hypothetical protein
MELIIKILVTVFIGVLVYLGVKIVFFKKEKSNDVGCGGGSSEREEGKPLPPKDSKNKENN